MLCGGDKTSTGYGMTGCYIWTSHGWKQSDTTFNRLVIHVTHLYFCVSG